MRLTLLAFAIAFTAPAQAQSRSPVIVGDPALGSVNRALAQLSVSFDAEITPALAEARAKLEAARSRSLGLRAAAPALDAARVALDQARYSLGERWHDSARAPAPWDDQDPADSLYRAARGALNRGSYSLAASYFARIRSTYPKSTYTPDAFYWEAFSQYRVGTRTALNAALEAIDTQAKQYPSASTRGEADALATRIRGVLARTGDAGAAEDVVRTAERVAKASADAHRAQTRTLRAHSRCRDDDDDEKTAALNALLQMDSERALPILKKVLARRDGGSECLRRRAVFLVSQHEGPETESLLLSTARTDPDAEVRSQAVFWLSQVDSEHAVAALDSILRGSTDDEIREKALFALSQHSSSRARQALRDFALKTDNPTDLREKAIFWIGQSDRDDNAPFLRSLYKTVNDESLKEKVIFSLSQTNTRENQRFLMQIAGDNAESIELRKKALFWLGQSDFPLSELTGLYDRMTDRDMREQLIFVYSQRNDRAAVDKLIQIVRTEKDRELRKKALFWLSQSRDPRAAEILGEILDKP